MAKNYYFENFENSMEQSLVEDLVIESIKIFGVDCYYIPRVTQTKVPAPRETANVVIAPDNITGGEITGVTFLNRGFGYLSVPTITISDPASGTTATAEVNLTNGVVSGVTITDGGSGYDVNNLPSADIQEVTETNVGQLAYIDSGYDDLLNEDSLPSYNSSYEVEMYVKNVDGFEGEGDFLSKFGLQIRDSMTLTVAMRTWEEEVAFNVEDERVRPLEGDLIFFPLNKKIFKIMHVEHEAIFYQMGSLQSYDLKCELFEYSNERFDTGISEIDELYDRYKTVVSNTDNKLEDAIDIVTQDVGENADNFVIENTGDNILDFSEGNPFGEKFW